MEFKKLIIGILTMFVKSELEKIISIEETIYRDFDLMKIDMDDFCKNNDRALFG